jgi:hypothetical protein
MAEIEKDQNERGDDAGRRAPARHAPRSQRRRNQEPGGKTGAGFEQRQALDRRREIALPGRKRQGAEKDQAEPCRRRAFELRRQARDAEKEQRDVERDLE